MKCFYHAAYEAVGICKNCQKGICANCAVDMENGLACKDRCEEMVEKLNLMFVRGTTSYQKSDRHQVLATGFFCLIGLLFTICGILSEIGFATAIGVIFLFYGIARIGIKKYAE